VDPLDPRLLAATGLDVDAPVVLSLLEPRPPGSERHQRLVARMANPTLFTAFLRNLGESGQLAIAPVAPRSPAGRARVVFAPWVPALGAGIVRMAGDNIVVDVVQPPPGASPWTPVQVARRYPLTPVRAFQAAGGARQIFREDAMLAAYADGRR